jgi:hypothetical protein
LHRLNVFADDQARNAALCPAPDLLIPHTTSSAGTRMRATPPRAKPFCDLTAAADLAIDQGVSASKQPIILRNNRIGLAKLAK